jgi:Na+/proline symporter
MTVLVFVSTIFVTFALTLFARKRSSKLETQALSEQGLNRWLVGLSAGATANSGFIVTAGVAVGYLYGTYWLLLPLAWLIGDLFFWKLFPAKINRFGRNASARTVTDLVTHGFTNKWTLIISLTVGLLIIAALMGYTSAQWLAGQKFMTGAFGVSSEVALGSFAALIIAYSVIGGFRGSIYADSFQAVIRVLATIIILWVVISVALNSPDTFWANINSQGEGFLNPLTTTSLTTILGFVLGFASAGFGFGLGQPQVISRYLAGKSPQETKSAQWIYIGFVQFTWISMTLFGIILKGIMPDIDAVDAESALSIFITEYFGPILAGLILADIFATIAATSNSLIVAIAQSLRNDILVKMRLLPQAFPLWPITLICGALSMIAAYFIGGTVLSLALASISFLAAGLAPAVIIKVMNLQHSAVSVFFAILGGLTIAFTWQKIGLSSSINESAPGMIGALIINYLIVLIRAGNGEKR